MATLVLMFAWLACPHAVRPEGVEVSVQEAPQLHALVTRVAAELDVRRPVRIVLSGDVKASLGLSGWRREPVLVLGVPLWCLLSPQGQVGLVAHDVAHLRHNGPARSAMTGLVVSVLERPSDSLRPDRIMRSKSGLVDMITNDLMTLLALVPLGVARLLAWLVGGRVHAHACRPPGGAVGGAAGRPGLHEPDDSYPATVDRMQVVRARPQLGTVHLNLAESERIRLELNPFVRPTEAQAQARWQYRLTEGHTSS